MDRYFAIVLFLFYLLSGCSTFSVDSQDLDKNGCPIPPTGVLTTSTELEIEGKVEKLILGKLTQKEETEFISFISENGENERTKIWWRCTILKMDKPPELNIWYVSLWNYVDSKPNADQIRSWFKENPPPKTTQVVMNNNRDSNSYFIGVSVSGINIKPQEGAQSDSEWQNKTTLNAELLVPSSFFLLPDTIFFEISRVKWEEDVSYETFPGLTESYVEDNSFNNWALGAKYLLYKNLYAGGFFGRTFPGNESTNYYGTLLGLQIHALKTLRFGLETRWDNYWSIEQKNVEFNPLGNANPQSVKTKRWGISISMGVSIRLF